MVVADMQLAEQHIRSSLGFIIFSILPKDTSTCRPGESNPRHSDNKTLALLLSHSRLVQQVCRMNPWRVVEHAVMLAAAEKILAWKIEWIMPFHLSYTSTSWMEAFHSFFFSLLTVFCFFFLFCVFLSFFLSFFLERCCETGFRGAAAPWLTTTWKLIANYSNNETIMQKLYTYIYISIFHIVFFLLPLTVKVSDGM